MRKLAMVWLLGALVGDVLADKRPPVPMPAAKLDEPCVDRAAGSCKHRALDHFRTALAANRTGRPQHPLRISYIGDSLTADDHIVGELRDKLGALIGAGGPGFVWADKPHPYLQHQAIQRVVGGSWKIHSVAGTIPGDHLLGLGGSAEGSGTIRLVPATPVSSVDVHYLAQPGGGRLEIVAGTKVVDTVTTAAPTKQARFERVAVAADTRRIELRAHGRVRLFGASLEAARGAVVDNLGIVNATAKGLVTRDLPEHLRNQLAHRDADLVIVMLGTNEAEWLAPKGAGMREHEKLFDELLSTIRTANPDGSCLVISPLDQLDWRQDDAPPRESVPAMVDAQHRAADAYGCAFWNAYEWMGGKGASRTWFRRGLVVKDFQHPTTSGAAKIAEALYRGLVR